jgi:hypothetical protein
VANHRYPLRNNNLISQKAVALFTSHVKDEPTQTLTRRTYSIQSSLSNTYPIMSSTQKMATQCTKRSSFPIKQQETIGKYEQRTNFSASSKGSKEEQKQRTHVSSSPSTRNQNTRSQHNHGSSDLYRHRRRNRTALI